VKRRDLIQHLTKYHCREKREGSKHSIWVNDQTGAWATVPRHVELKKSLAKDICKQLGVPRP
jgi:mRNA interferase HicA